MNPLDKLLEEIRDSTAKLTAWKPVPPDSAPLTLLALVAAATLALNFNTLIVFAALVSITLLTVACLARGSSLRGVEAILYPLCVAGVASIPLVAWGRFYDAASLLFRSVASAAILTLVTCYMGWPALIDGLRRLHVPSSLLDSILMLSYFIPRFSNTVLRLTLARRARHIAKPRIRDWWRIQSSALGELMIRAFESSERLALAMRARSLSGNSVSGNMHTEKDPIGATRILVYAALLLIITAGVLHAIL